MSSADVALVSLHGTGTPLGDPIEVGALGQALSTAGHSGRRATPAASERALAVLSSKACFGHSEGNAGLAGLLLAVQVRLLDALFHFRLCAAHWSCPGVSA